ncbi:hypothetical protein FHW36_104176 [Chitinophaga polysaccharea]|uniref:Carboxypeptidase-like protein n=1 Tax=Chitinophaga polysaccharea TaxID=1293035 RepID=A0A561PQU8_9BACT|nr:carboxypeptidase-like regulatory domain-containing protein [Chitinophaga polysaccharea]TWF40494.1 hypothetical protein FHW36_104176 [Chitinophaga polysaccharea]
MGISTHLQKVALLAVLILAGIVSQAQVRVSGTVYDRTQMVRMAGVSVMSNSGAGAITDSLGHYSIIVPVTDSISFSYQGKPTMKFAVREIPFNRPFDMSLHVSVMTLPTVVVTEKMRGYKFDSLERRNEYRKVFDYAPDYLTSGGNGVGAGVNLDALLSIRKIKRMEAFRRFLERDEREKYIDYRFNAVLVKKITGLQSPALEAFMKEYRPSYELLLSFETEYQYYKYIRDCGRFYTGNNTSPHQ